METSQNRQGEYGGTPFRSGRFFVAANRWYFSTREGINKGPYTSRLSAQNALDTFIDKCKKYDAIFH